MNAAVPVINLDHALEVARAAAAAADAVAMRYFQSQGLEIERKSDDSPVTVADRACEQEIRRHILDAFPDHAIYGEEYGHEGQGEALWLIDPIDGTRSFIRGLPFWSVQIALMLHGELVLGVSSAPAFGETAWALKGRGAWIDGQRANASAALELESADVSFGNLRSLAGRAGWSVVGQIVGRAARSRGYGDFYAYHRLAEGSQDVVIESDVNILDIAALSLICTEAGAVVSDLDGRPIGLDTRSILAASAPLHPKLLEMFRGA
ncbi:MAG: inositol monophosphatase family protein [Wenzhouxiangella sp.]